MGNRLKYIPSIFVTLLLSLGVSTSWGQTDTWAVVDEVTHEAPGCKLFGQGNIIYSSFYDQKNRKHGYKIFQIDLIKGKFISRGAALSTDLKTLQRVQKTFGQKYVYLRRDSVSGISPFGGSFLGVYKGKLSGQLEHVENLARPSAYNSEAIIWTGKGLVAMKSNLWNPIVQSEILIFKENAGSWQKIHTFNAAKETRASVSPDGDLFAVGDTQEINLYKWKKQSGIVSAGIMRGSFDNYSNFSIGERFVIAQEWSKTNREWNVQIFDPSEGYEVFSEPFTKLLIPKGPTEFYPINKGTFIITSGSLDGGIVILQTDDPDTGYEWVPVFSKLGQNKKIGRCVVKLNESSFVFSEKAQNGLLKLSLVSRTKNINNFQKINAPVTGGPVISQSPETISLIHPIGRIQSLLRGQDSKQLFVYEWNHSSNNNKYLLKQWIPDTTEVRACRSRAITHSASQPESLLKATDWCSLGKCYFVGSRYPATKCNGNSFIQSWQVTPYFDAEKANPTNQVSFERDY